ncbi:MAG: branched-chain amino acid ABC transporter permease/ATP-binding protein [Nocardioides sp.]|uniref:ABC transporter permease subunit n=1 Tax=Nocardioides sp. TaxID=35761 RepID=UPI0039E31E34
MGSIDVVFLILGLGNGAVYAALALALVVTYRSSGVVNLATGAIALYVAYTYAFLRKGELINPIPGFSATVDLGGPLEFWPAFAISLVVAAIVGAVLYALVFRPLRSAPATAKAVASVGVMIVIQELLSARLGTTGIQTPPIFSSHVYTIFGSRVPGDRLWFAAIIVLMSIALGLWFRFTRFGLATRAAAESEKGAFVTGISPQRIALINWSLSTVIGGIGGILIAPIVPLTPASYTVFLVAALAAALAGNFSRIGITVTAALVIGMLQSEATHLQAKSWLPDSGLADLVPLLVILGFLLLRGQELPHRGAVVQQTLGVAPRPRGYLLPAISITALGLIGLTTTHGSVRGGVITSMILAVIVLSQVVVTGFSGQISFAQLTLAGVAAFSLTRIQEQLHVPFPFAPLLAALVAMVVGVVVGLPALRIRGLPVAVTTLALAVVLQTLWFENVDFNGGYSGAPIADPHLFGLDLGVGAGEGYPHLSFGILTLVVLLLIAGGVAMLRRSRLGAAMLAVRANERSAAAAGLSVSRVKLIAFAIGGFIAGLGGSMMGYQQTAANFSSYTAFGSLALFTTAYLSGITSVSGGINAGVIASGGLVYVLVFKGLPLWIYILVLGLLVLGVVRLVAPKLTRIGLGLVALGTAAALFHHGPVKGGEYFTTVSGLFLILTVILNPEGIVGEVHAQIAHLRARRQTRRPQDSAPRSSPDADLVHDTGTTPASAPVASSPVAIDPILTISEVGVRYGRVVANEDVSFEARSGEIIGLIGPNGAGKTTLIDAITGFARSTGSVTLDGLDLSGLKPFERSRKGLGRTFQGIELYEDLSVRENVEVGTTAARYSHADGALDIDVYLGLVDLSDVAHRPVRELSVGQRQLVSVARALAGRPRVVLLDEPAAGLDTGESQWLGERLRRVRDAGISVVMVEHDMGLVLDICDRIVVLNLGKVVAVGTPAEIQGNDEVKRAYLGTTHAAQAGAGA